MLSSGSPSPSSSELLYSRSTLATGDSATAIAAPSRPRTSGWHQPPIPWVTDWIDKNRKLLFAIALLPYLLTFNGRWRIGLDSAAYRGLGHSLAAGRGYQFGEFATKQAYPGLPLLLAGFEKIFGPMTFRPAPVLLLMVGLALLTLAIVYRLIGMLYPRWVAVCVTVGLAINARFVSLSTEVLTDVPFLFGLVTALYGWELLRQSQTSQSLARHTWRSLAIMCGGLAVAASMRPTFWVIAAAWGIVCAWGILRGPQRRFFAIALTALLVVWAAMIALDPRTGKGLHFSPLSGGYEEEAVDALQAAATHLDPDTRMPSLAHRLRQNLPALLERHLYTAFAGQPMPPIPSAIVSLVLIVSPLFFFRRRPLWALLVPLTIGVTLLLSTEPRYYVMIAPFLLLGWILAVRSITTRIPGGWGDLVLLAAIGPVAGINISKIIPLIIDQQRVPIWATEREFYKRYRGGEFAPIIDLAKVVREKTTPADKTIAPSASVVAYLSDRQVLRQREVLPLKTSIKHAPQRLATMKPDYVVLPWKLYRDKDPEIARLIQRRVLVPGHKLARVDGVTTLAKARVVVRKGDWREGKPPRTAHAAGQAKKFVPPHRKAAMQRAKLRAAKSSAAAHPGAAATVHKKKKRTTAPATAPSATSFGTDYRPVPIAAIAWRSAIF